MGIKLRVLKSTIYVPESSSRSEEGIVKWMRIIPLCDTETAIISSPCTGVRHLPTVYGYHRFTTNDTTPHRKQRPHIPIPSLCIVIISYYYLYQLVFLVFVIIIKPGATSQRITFLFLFGQAMSNSIRYHVGCFGDMSSVRCRLREKIACLYKN